MLLTSIALSGAALSILHPNLPKATLRKRQAPRSGFIRALPGRIDAHIQRFFVQRIDPLFASRARVRQMAEFDFKVSEEEANVNRRIAVSVVTVGFAAAGTAGVPLASALSVIGMIIVVTPKAVKYAKLSWRQKRVKYRFVTPFFFLARAVSGHVLVSSLLTMVFAATYKISTRTKAVTRASMREAFGMQPPQMVWAVVDGVEVEVPFCDVQVGDVLVVSAGQTIPVDGVVSEGEGAVDQHTLTGESRPAEKAAGDPVLANSVLLSGRLRIEVHRAGADTAAAQIGAILAKAADTEMELADRSERFADTLVPPLAVASAVALKTIGTSSAYAVMSGPFGATANAAGPLCMVSFLNIASQQGVLIKNGLALERLHKIDTVVFDKTGTLTQEQPAASEIHVVEGRSAAAVLRYAALAEHRQTHPIAKAILAEAKAAGIEISAPDDAEYSVGMGVSVRLGDQTIHVGSARFLATQRIPLAEEAQAWRDACDAEGGSLVFVALNGACIGAIRLNAQLRPNTKELIDALKARGLKTYILSGDARAPAEHLAAELGMDGCFAEVLPQDKAQAVASLQAEGRSVCFVGDGINDALALQKADVSISLRGATTLATDSAQIVLMSPSLEQIETLFDLGAQFDRTLTRTLALGNGVGLTLVGGVFLFGFGMPATVPFCALGLGSAVISAVEPMRALGGPRKTNQKTRKQAPPPHRTPPLRIAENPPPARPEPCERSKPCAGRKNGERTSAFVEAGIDSRP